MKKTTIILLLFAGIIFSNARAQDITMYRLILSDKGDAGYSVDRPEEFLSQKSIERRQKQNLAVNETDLPIDPAYFTRLEDLGAKVRTYSKWVQTIVVDVEDESILSNIRSLSFVEDLYPVWRGRVWGEPVETIIDDDPPGEPEEIELPITLDDYGYSQTQNNIFNSLPLHNEGYFGGGISVALMDGGYLNTDRVLHFDQERIKEVKNFTHEYGDPLKGSQDHGTAVLSCILTNTRGIMIGTAPHADFYLYKTEVNGSEYPIEEDYWVAAVEYADSLGIDIISTSLGYATFDDPTMNHTHAQLDGQTVPSSRAASMIASKGMILCHSAGNSGNKEWQRVNVSADASDILTVGAVQASGEVSSFSSWGYTVDNRVKPDVMAMGSMVWVIDGHGFNVSSGTSASCPLMAGMTACLWQALPHLTSYQIMDLIRRSADRYDNPNQYYGYGIPDFHQAYLAGKDITPIEEIDRTDCMWIDPVNNIIHIRESCFNGGVVNLSIYTPMGSRALSRASAATEVDVSRLAPGMYIAFLQWNDVHIVKKFIRR